MKRKFEPDDDPKRTIKDRLHTIELIVGSTNSLVWDMHGYIEHMHYIMEQKWGTKPDE